MHAGAQVQIGDLRIVLKNAQDLAVDAVQRENGGHWLRP